jgi:TorA maturation chaperone TorD
METASSRAARVPAGASDPVERDRAQLFGLLARLLSAPPDAALLAGLGALQPDDSPLGRALRRLGEAAAVARPEQVEREYFELFIGVGRGELVPYGSYYLTGFLHDRPLALLRGDLAALGVRRSAGSAEPEDHIAFACDTLAGLLAGRFEAGPEAAGGFFARHLQPWGSRCFADLEAAQAARFYRPVGALGRLACDLEAAALELAT